MTNRESAIEDEMQASPITTPLILRGVPGSPYTRKMLAVLRYRRIPYRVLIPGSPAAADIPKPKVDLQPTFYLPDGDGDGGTMAVTDSTPLIRPSPSSTAFWRTMRTNG